MKAACLWSPRSVRARVWSSTQQPSSRVQASTDPSPSLLEPSAPALQLSAKRLSSSPLINLHPHPTVSLYFVPRQVGLDKQRVTVWLGCASSDARQGEQSVWLSARSERDGPWGDSQPTVGAGGGGGSSGRLSVSITARISLQMLLAPQRRKDGSLARPLGTIALTLSPQI